MQFRGATLGSSVILARAVQDNNREKLMHTNEESIGGLGSWKFKCTKTTITKKLQIRCTTLGSSGTPPEAVQVVIRGVPEQFV
jgi:hypothetical protein